MVNLRTYKDPLAAALRYCLWSTKHTQDEVAIAVGYKNRNMIAAILNEQSPGSEPKRRAIAAFFGLEYEPFLELGRQIIRNSKIVGNIENSGPEQRLEAFKKNAEVALIKQQQSEQNFVADIVDEARKRHQIVIEGFEDKEWALAVNEMLVEIEKRAPELKEIAKGAIENIFRNLPKIEETKKTGTTNKPER